MAKKEEKPPQGSSEETPFQRLERLTKKIVQVPKDAVREPKKDRPQTSG